MGIPKRLKAVVYHPLFANPAISLGLSALSLLLLVLTLLSVPGPIKGLYWFSIEGEQSGEGPMNVGVLGWCMTETANCTYAPLSENKYLSTMIDSGQALTVRVALPLACYWMIVTLVCWVLLCVTSPMGYRIKDLDSIRRHLYFAVLEACVLCVTLFGNVLCWLAVGLGRAAYETVKSGGGRPKSGQAMETSAVAALMSLLSFFTALWGLHLRLASAQKAWKDQAVMIRRRSLALTSQGIPTDSMGNRLDVSLGDRKLGGAESLTMVGSDGASGLDAGEKEKRLSMLSVNGYSTYTGYTHEYNGGNQTVSGGPNGGTNGSMNRASILKSPVQGHDDDDEEERLETELQTARRNSREHAILQRASVISPNDSPYAAATAQNTTEH